MPASTAFVPSARGAPASGALRPSDGATLVACVTADPRRAVPCDDPLNTSPSRSREASVPAGRKSSMNGNAAFMPAASGW